MSLENQAKFWADQAAKESEKKQADKDLESRVDDIVRRRLRPLEERIEQLEEKLDRLAQGQ